MKNVKASWTSPVRYDKIVPATDRRKTLKQLKEDLKDVPTEHLYKMLSSGQYSEYHKQKEQTPLVKLINLCRSIARTDQSFENLTSEVTMAKRVAQENLERACQIRDIIKTIKPDEAQLALEILNVMNIMFMRVLGDQMSHIEFESTNLEDWIKNQSRNPYLRDMAERESLILFISKSNM